MALLICITGPSGLRKSRLIEKAIQQDGYKRLVAYTDRPRQDHEMYGEEYYFISPEEFTESIDQGEFVEWQKLISNGYRYGKKRKDIDKSLEEYTGQVLFSVINVVNLPVFKRHYPKSISIFLDIPDVDFIKESVKATIKENDNFDEEFERRFDFIMEEKRRRHLADYYMRIAHDPLDSFDEFMELVEKIRKSFQK